MATTTVAATVGERKRKGRAISPPQADDLLAWYDRHRRRLPWRVGAGDLPDPYRVWLSEIMLQQTTVKAVAPYYARFLERFPTVSALAAAPLDDVLRLWAGLGYYARARNLHACARTIHDHHGGQFPDSEVALAELPGIGPYTAAAVAAIAFDARATPVDGNIERVVTRLYAIEQELPAAKPAVRGRAAALTPARRAGDFAQAMMDLGATICTPARPACGSCPWTNACAARIRGDAETFPRKARKREGTLRRGAAFVAVRADARLLLRTRPATGLLGGMTEVPTTQWAADFDEARALETAPSFGGKETRVSTRWRRVPGVVTHVFTHFPLELAVFIRDVPVRTRPPDGMRWIALADVPGEALPNVMRKVVAHALPRTLSARPSRRDLSKSPLRGVKAR